RHHTTGFPRDGPGGRGAMSRSRNEWRVSETQADLVRVQQPPVPLSIQAQPKPITSDLARTGIIVVDMQNDFCHPDGWLASIGVNIAPARTPIQPLSALLPKLRAAK